jgi:hypothetical protein
VDGDVQRDERKPSDSVVLGMNRRGFLGTLAAAVAAPFVKRTRLDEMVGEALAEHAAGLTLPAPGGASAIIPGGGYEYVPYAATIDTTISANATITTVTWPGNTDTIYYPLSNG